MGQYTHSTRFVFNEEQQKYEILAERTSTDFIAFIIHTLSVLERNSVEWSCFDEFFNAFVSNVPSKSGKELLLVAGEEFLKKVLRRLYESSFKEDILTKKERAYLEDNSFVYDYSYTLSYLENDSEEHFPVIRVTDSCALKSES